MSAWRKEAIQLLPGQRHLIEQAENPMALWLELRLVFEEAVSAGDRDCARRVLDYAAWCVSEAAGELPSDASSAAACGFYEHLPENASHWAYFNEWFTPEEFRRLRPLFGYSLGVAGAAALGLHYWRHQRRAGRPEPT